MSKTIFILGQSISLHWGAYLQEKLGDNFIYKHKTGKEIELRNHPELQKENGGSSADVLLYVQLMTDLHPDLLLVGAGLHDIRRDSQTNDIFITLEAYKNNLQAIVKLCKTRHISIAWMTTTSFDESRHNALNDKNKRLLSDNQEYNETAMAIMKENSIPIVDIRSFTENLVKDQNNEMIYKDHIHFQESIREAQASFVADWIHSHNDILN